MADWLLLRLPRTPQEQATWLVVDGRGTASGPPHGGPLSLAAPRAAGRHVVVLVPGADVLLAQPELPTAKAGAKLQQLVPFALEEQLAEDIEDLHFAIGRRQGDSARVPVAVAGRKLMDEWITLLKSSGLEPEALYADSELLPQNPGQSVALIEEDAVVVRPPSGNVVTLPADALDEALEIALSGIEPGTPGGRGLILYTGAAEWQRHSSTVEAARERFEGIQIQLLTGGPLTLFAQQLPTATPTNLLQGPYTPAATHPVGWNAWRVAAMLLAGFIGLHVAGKAAELSVLKHADHKLDASIEQVFQMALPGEPVTYEARRVMEQRLAAARASQVSGGFLSALQALVQAHRAAPEAVLEAMTFRDGALELKATAPSVETLDRLSRQLRQQGWQARLTAGTPKGSSYEGSIQMSPGS
ncbi:MAG TPA: type II secretion system protein GspL [Steroidobacteraceae bacterium]|jgi:general secretion pathway protein L|nr:type II secretion system protein GspL [Steroidobacteraceae bacterium]